MISVTTTGSGYAAGDTVTIVIDGNGAVRTNIYDHTGVEQKSLDLLKQWLTKDQMRDFTTWSWFCVKGNVTCKKYRITQARVFGVHELDNKNNRVRSLCFVPVSAYSIGDIMLAQKIMLERREAEVLKIANFSTGAVTAADYRFADELSAVTRRCFRNVMP